jgi:pimeloyl-ACP methyl ester carboxylesterase
VSGTESPVSGPEVVTRDGRRLCYEQIGDPLGAPVLVLHGTPGSRLSGVHAHRHRVAEAGLRVISYDRPGYGGSSRHPGRRVVDCVGDIAAIADQLGLDRFAVSGGSGGGPHALAAGARLAGRVTIAACHVGAAPYDAPDLDWFDGMDPVNVRELGWALAGEETLAAELAREARNMLDRLEQDPAALLEDIELAASDRTVLERPDVRGTLSASTREAFSHGVSGWVDDDLAFVAPWGFEVEEITVPVEVRYGEGDGLVPTAHGRWLATHIPGASVTVDPDRGHLSTPDEQLERLRALVVD